jgi:multidrug efflux pump subunit AcrB
VAYYLWGPVGFLLVLAPLLRRPFNWAVEATTSAYAAFVRRTATHRWLTVLLIGAFFAGIALVFSRLPSGFIPGEDQGVIYAVIQTPPGSTLEYTNSKAHELEAIVKEVEEVTSVTSLAGYEVLTEGRGANRAPDYRGTRGGLPTHCQRQARVFRTSGGSRFRRRRRLFDATARQDEFDGLQATGDGHGCIHGGFGKTKGTDGTVHILQQRLPAI